MLLPCFQNSNADLHHIVNQALLLNLESPEKSQHIQLQRLPAAAGIWAGRDACLLHHKTPPYTFSDVSHLDINSPLTSKSSKTVGVAGWFKYISFT